jgi:hypothetical protein
MRRVRPATLAGGLALVVLGVWILLDVSGELALSFDALGAVLAGTCGLILLASGLEGAE